MRFFPAIDILDGQVVRLRQGKYDEVTGYLDNPVRQAELFAEAGSRWVHVVDLSGAKAGCPQALDIVSEIIRSSGLHVEVGGGVRGMQAMDEYAAIGAERVVIGTALVKDPGFAQEAAKRYPGMIVAGIDARGGKVALEGWTEDSGVDAADLALKFKDLGINDAVYTDISRDGMQTGVDVEGCASLGRRSGMRVVASGGVASLDDLLALRDAGVWGAIAGRALYEGAFSVQQALLACEEEGDDAD